MRTKAHLYLAVTFLCLLAVRAEVKEFTFDFSVQKMDVASASVNSFAIGDTINLTLPEDQPSFSLEIVAAPPAGIAGPSYIAKDMQGQASAVVKPTKDGLRITVDDFAENRVHAFRIKDGQTTYAVHEKSTEPEECATCAEAAVGGRTCTANPTDEKPCEMPARKSATLQSVGSELDLDPSYASVDTLLPPLESEFRVAPQKAVVDILVAFDQGAVLKSAALGYDTITNFADYAVSKMNTVLENSQLDDEFFYRLVGVIEVDATYDVINNDLLNALRLRNNGALAPVGAAREKYGADTITLLIDRDRNKSTTSGSGYEYLSNSWTYAEFDAKGYTCNICDIKTVYERYTMSHETGHNMGCGHSNRQGDKSGPGCHPYSCGYHFVDAAGTNRYTIMAYENTSPASGTYYPVPYFSSPDITPEELGVPVGTPTNNNRQTILDNYRDVAAWREHVIPYEWDVRFLDENGNDIPDGTFFTGTLYVTLTNSNPAASIYYTTDGTTPGANSWWYLKGSPLPILDTTTITACAVTNGVAISFRKITVNEGAVWSGEAGLNGNGRWIDDSSVLAWDGATLPFNYGSYPSVCFADLAGISSATVTVEGTVAPYSASFTATDTSYVFAKGTSDALIHLRDASFAPSCDLTFNLPIGLTATNFISPAGHTVTFNAPFGTNVAANASYGHCTNMIVVGDYGTLVVAPGEGKTQVFDRFNNIGTYWNTATFRAGEGTVRFKGPYNGGQGLFGGTKIVVGQGGSLEFDCAAATGYDRTESFTVENGGNVYFKEDEHMRRELILAGGSIYASKRLDRMHGSSITVSQDSLIQGVGNGRILIRYANETIDVANGKTLTLDIETQDGANTTGFGIVKTGGGEILAKRKLSHSGATVISNGTFTVGYSSSTRVGLGWSVAVGATLKLKDGCSLAVPTLTLEGGATIALPATNAAPLSATNDVSVAGVMIELSNATNLSLGASYPLLASEGGISGVENMDWSRLPTLASGLEWRMDVADGTLCAKVAREVLQFVVARGETVNLSDIPATATSVIGEGTICCGATLPDASLGWTNADWKGTLVFERLVAGSATQNFQFELYGNANSKILLRNCSISYLKDNNATFAGTLVLKQDNDGHVAFMTNNGYSEKYNVFGALEGNGAMSFTTGQRQGYVFETATNYSGSISIGAQNNGGILGGRYIIFGTIASASELPANTHSATITVKQGATASIGGGATWYAYHGVEVGGTLLVKGADATLDCHASAAMGLKLDDGATLRFDAADAKLTFAKAPQFAAGTVNIAFADGVAPTNGMVLVHWPDGSLPNAGDFAFADSALSERFVLNKTATGLVVGNAPLPEKVEASITVLNGDWVESVFECDLPTSWATNYYPSLDTPEAVAAKYNETAANGATVWQSYMLGLDPTNAASTVSLSMVVEGNEIRFAVEGLGESHALEGINVYWYMKTSTNLVTDASFSKTRDTAQGLSPTFPVHPMPDKPTAGATQTVDKLFYKITVTFVAEDE